MTVPALHPAITSASDIDFAAHRLRRAAKVVKRGGVLAYPSEGVWGLGCDPLDENAIGRILQMKARAPRKGLIVLAARVEQLGGYVASLSADEFAQVAATWPGPNTWILPAGPWALPLLTGGRETIAVRVTAHPLLAALCELTGPLVSTSANVSGKAAALYRRQVQSLRADYVLNGSLQRPGQPSSIYTLAGARLR